jgi:hypothetical protein
MSETYEQRSKSPLVEMSFIETQNRDALSKMVMAGLRLYGLQSKRPTKKCEPGVGPVQANPLNDEPVDEYKLVYHQTFKGACFALRRQLQYTVLRQQDMRDSVDKLLALYCADPLVPDPSSRGGGDMATPMFGTDREEQNPFFLGAANLEAVTSTPTVRRRRDVTELHHGGEGQ